MPDRPRPGWRGPARAVRTLARNGIVAVVAVVAVGLAGYVVLPNFRQTTVVEALPAPQPAAAAPAPVANATLRLAG